MHQLQVIANSLDLSLLEVFLTHLGRCTLIHRWRHAPVQSTNLCHRNKWIAVCPWMGLKLLWQSEETNENEFYFGPVATLCVSTLFINIPFWMNSVSKFNWKRTFFENYTSGLYMLAFIGESENQYRVLIG